MSRITTALVVAIAIAATNSSPSPEAESAVLSREPRATGAGTPSAETEAAVDAAPRVSITVDLAGATVYAQTLEQLDDVQWALGRYAEAGLVLPHVTIEMRSPGECPRGDGGQNAASHTVTDRGEHWIKNCGTRRTLLHELGHAWAKVTLTEAQKLRFKELRGLGTWKHEIWHLAAGEHVAEVLSWALDEVPLPPSRIPNSSVSELAAAYSLLTGMDAPVLTLTPRVSTAAEAVGDRQILETTGLVPGKGMG